MLFVTFGDNLENSIPQAMVVILFFKER